MKKIISVLMAITILIAFAGCGNQDDIVITSDSTSTETTISDDNIVSDNSNKKILIAYFSRYGNTDFDDNVDASSSASIVMNNNEKYGTTEYMANIIQQATSGDVYLIETQEKYATDFNQLRDDNHKEMDENVLPALKDKGLDLSAYNTVFIGYPVWATDVPQAVLSFLNEYDLSDKTVIPFCTHDGYGAGSSYQSIADASHSKNMLSGIAVEANDVSSAKEQIADWLTSIGITANKNVETQLEIKIGDLIFNGVLYDTDLADEIKDKLPITVNMSNFGGRELYGRIGFTPVNATGGQLNFEDGDITYCSTNNTLAIFYSQSDNPNLTMEVIPVGKITSDLSIFHSLNSSEEVTFSLAK